MAEKTAPEVRQLLYSRKQACRLLGNVNPSYLRRLEKAGRLKVIRLSGSKQSMAFYRLPDLTALVEQGASNA